MTNESSKKDDKKTLVDICKKVCLLTDNFTGRLVISVTNGGINYIEKTETIK